MVKSQITFAGHNPKHPSKGSKAICVLTSTAFGPDPFSHKAEARIWTSHGVSAGSPVWPIRQAQPPAHLTPNIHFLKTTHRKCYMTDKQNWHQTNIYIYIIIALLILEVFSSTWNISRIFYWIFSIRIKARFSCVISVVGPASLQSYQRGFLKYNVSHMLLLHVPYTNHTQLEKTNKQNTLI